MGYPLDKLFFLCYYSFMKHFKKYFLVILLAILLGSTVHAFSLAERLEGKILLQVQEHGEAWYVHEGKRYYMKDGATAYEMMRFFSLGITNENLEQIPVGEIEVSETKTQEPQTIFIEKECPVISTIEYQNKISELEGRVETLQNLLKSEQTNAPICAVEPDTSLESEPIEIEEVNEEMTKEDALMAEELANSAPVIRTSYFNVWRTGMPTPIEPDVFMELGSSFDVTIPRGKEIAFAFHVEIPRSLYNQWRSSDIVCTYTPSDWSWEEYADRHVEIALFMNDPGTYSISSHCKNKVTGMEASSTINVIID